MSYINILIQRKRKEQISFLWFFQIKLISFFTNPSKYKCHSIHYYFLHLSNYKSNLVISIDILLRPFKYNKPLY